MKKLAIILLGVFFLTGFLVVPSMAKGPSKQAGKSNIGHLYLYEKAPNPEAERTDPWLIVPGGAWGKMKYNLSGPTFDFVFNGHGLVQSVDYTLIYYPDSWPADGFICLGDGTTTYVTECTLEEVAEGCVPDDGGNIHIQDSVDTGSLPIESDDNCIEYNYAAEICLDGGAKIFLVLFDDVDCEGQVMARWTGDDANLYEDVLITFEDTNGGLNNQF